MEAKKNPRKKKIVVSKLSTVRFKYLFNDDYHPEYVSGVFGGPTPKGDVVMNFYFERQGLPISQTYVVNGDNTLGAEINDKLDPPDLLESFVRQVKSGIIMNKSTASEMREWLDGVLKYFEEQEKEEQELTGQDKA